MQRKLENVLETLRESLNYEDWNKVENAVEELEMLQEQILLDTGYDDSLIDEGFAI